MTKEQNNFLSELKTCLLDAHKHVLKINNEKQELIEEKDAGKFTQEYVTPLLKERDIRIENVVDECEKTALSIIDRRIEKLESYTTLDPEKITADAELLKLDGLVTQKDLDAMLKRNGGNPTMTRLIARYANANNLRVELPHYVFETAHDIRSTENFKSSMHYMKRWVGDVKNGESLINRIFAPYGV